MHTHTPEPIPKVWPCLCWAVATAVGGAPLNTPPRKPGVVQAHTAAVAAAAAAYGRLLVLLLLLLAVVGRGWGEQ